MQIQIHPPTTNNILQAIALHHTQHKHTITNSSISHAHTKSISYTYRRIRTISQAYSLIFARGNGNGNDKLHFCLNLQYLHANCGFIISLYIQHTHTPSICIYIIHTHTSAIYESKFAEMSVLAPWCTAVDDAEPHIRFSSLAMMEFPKASDHNCNGALYNNMSVYCTPL